MGETALVRHRHRENVSPRTQAVLEERVRDVEAEQHLTGRPVVGTADIEVLVENVDVAPHALEDPRFVDRGRTAEAEQVIDSRLARFGDPDRVLMELGALGERDAAEVLTPRGAVVVAAEDGAARLQRGADRSLGPTDRELVEWIRRRRFKAGWPTRVGSTASTSSSARCASPTARLAKPGATLLMIGSWYFGSSIEARPKNEKHLDSGTVTPSIVNVIEPVPRRPATCQSSMSVTSSGRTTTIWISGSPPIPGFGAPASSSATTLASTHCA